jgi:hypothetical protein
MVAAPHSHHLEGLAAQVAPVAVQAEQLEAETWATSLAAGEAQVQFPDWNLGWSLHLLLLPAVGGKVGEVAVYCLVGARVVGSVLPF